MCHNFLRLTETNTQKFLHSWTVRMFLIFKCIKGGRNISMPLAVPNQSIVYVIFSETLWLWTEPISGPKGFRIYSINIVWFGTALARGILAYFPAPSKQIDLIQFNFCISTFIYLALKLSATVSNWACRHFLQEKNNKGKIFKIALIGFL